MSDNLASGGDNNKDGDGGSRVPKDMKGLLQFCIENGATFDNNETQEGPQPLSQERREWLEEALTEMSVNPVQRMKLCLDALEKTDEEKSLDEKIAAIEEITEWCESIDLAIDLHKIGGFETLRKLFSHPEDKIRSLAFELLATVVQNNPYCQKAAVEKGFISIVLEHLDKDSDITVRTKALLAASCSCRESEECLNKFIENDGFSCLIRAMQTNDEKLTIKSAFLLSSLCRDRPDIKDLMCDIGMIDQLAGQLQEEHSHVHEHIMSALLSIIRDHQRAIQECQRGELNLHATLQNRKVLIKDKEEYLEELEYAEEILKLISQNTNAEEATR